MANYDNMSFNQAFKAARQGGARTFTWKGKNYGTRVAGESDFDYEHGLISRIGNQFRPNTTGILFEQNTPIQTQQPSQIQDNNMDNMSFSQAFRQARTNGISTFTWKGKDYGTKLKSEVTPIETQQEKSVVQQDNITVNPTSETPIEVKATRSDHPDVNLPHYTRAGYYEDLPFATQQEYGPYVYNHAIKYTYIDENGITDPNKTIYKQTVIPKEKQLIDSGYTLNDGDFILSEKSPYIYDYENPYTPYHRWSSQQYIPGRDMYKDALKRFRKTRKS